MGSVLTDAEMVAAGFIPVELVPVEVFGGNDCCTHGDHPDPAECPSMGYGLSDAVSAWSDCNRARGRVYRAEDTRDADDGTAPSRYREPGETVIVWVREVDMPFFARRFGDEFTEASA